MLFRLHEPDALAVDFKQVIISVIWFTVLFANQITLYSTSVAHVLLVLTWLFNTSALAADSEQVIFPVICFLLCLLTRYWFLSCQQHMSHRFRLLCIYGVFADFEQAIVPVLLYWHYLLTRYWFAKCQEHLYIEAILQYNSGSIAADLEQVIVLIRLFFTWVLCIYIILEKGCHFLCF